MQTLCIKYQDQIRIDGVLYVHPYLQTTNVFIGQFLCLLVFAIKMLFGKGSLEESLGTIKWWKIPFVVFVPAVCEILGTTF
jgi:hypothetical protein